MPKTNWPAHVIVALLMMLQLANLNLSRATESSQEVKYLILWNKLGSDNEIAQSEVGVPGEKVGDLLYQAGHDGNGFRSAARTGDPNIPNNFVLFRNLQLPPKGELEFWYTPFWKGSQVGHVVDFLHYSEIQWPNEAADILGPRMYFGYNDWQNRAAYGWLEGPANENSSIYYSYPSQDPQWILGTPMKITMKWDGSLPSGTSKVEMLFNDSVPAPHEADAGGTGGTFAVNAPMNLYLGSRPYSGDWHRHPWEPNVDGVIDDLKIWGYAELPSAPQGVHMGHGDHWISAWWSMPASDGGAPITHYEVTLQPGDITKVVSASGVRAESFTGYNPATTYTVSVRAVNVSGPGPAATATLPCSLCGSVPSAPQDLNYARNADWLSVWWNPPASDGGSPVMSYKVTLMNSGGVVASHTTTELAFSFNGYWTEGQFNSTDDYTITVAAMNAIGTGPAASVFAEGLGAPPSMPLNLQTGSGTHWVSAWWAPSADDGGSPILSYEVTISPAGPGDDVETRTRTVVLPAQLVESFNTSEDGPGSQALIKVVAINANGSSVAAQTVVTIPGAP